MERVDTVVVGAGQAGLAVSRFLTDNDREHVVLERGRIAETWRSARWDGFYLNTPNWSLQLPGAEYDGDEPDAFAPRADVVDHLETYAATFSAPVREHLGVTRLRRAADGYELDTDAGAVAAWNVVVTTGAFQQHRPRVPGAESASVELQLTASEYRRPEQLPEGAVLIVGGGQSGCQIADELLTAGREVFLSTGRCGWFPRRYRGHDFLHWAGELGLLDQTVDSLPSPAARLACNPPISGNDGGHDCHPRWLAGRGARVVGRLVGVEREIARFEAGVEAALADSDRGANELLAAIDAYAAETGLDLPEPEPRDVGPSPIADSPVLNLRDRNVSTILWASGFRPDYSWIELEVSDEHGWPVQTRGVSAHPGLYFTGVNWLYKRKSALFCGVGEDAGHVVSELVARR